MHIIPPGNQCRQSREGTPSHTVAVAYDGSGAVNPGGVEKLCKIRSRAQERPIEQGVMRQMRSARKMPTATIALPIRTLELGR